MKKIDWEALNEKVANSVPRKQGGRGLLTWRQREEIAWKVFTEEYDVDGGLQKLADEYGVKRSAIAAIKVDAVKGKGWGQWG